MRRRVCSPLTVLIVMMLTLIAPPLAFQGPPAQPVRLTEPVELPTSLFQMPEGLEVTVWATTPLLRNPTNMDIDKDGRIWVAEGVRYRSHHARQPEGDRIVVLQDTDGDGRADTSHTFVQEPALIAPLGVSVIDNKIIVAQPPDLIVYTDVDRNLRFDPAIDTARGAADRVPGHQSRPLAALGDGRTRRQVGVQLRQHGRDVHGSVGEDLPHLQRLPSRPRGPVHVSARSGAVRRQAERRRPRVHRRLHGPDEPGRNERRDHRPQLSERVRAVGDVARRRLPERQRRPARVPRELGDGVRELRVLVARRSALVAGRPAPRPVDSRSPSGVRTIPASRRSATSTAAAHRPATCSTRTARSGRRGRARSSRPTPDAMRSSRISRSGRARASRSIVPSSSPRTSSSSTPGPTSSAATSTASRGARDVVPAVGRRGRARRRAVCQRLDRSRASAVTRIWTKRCRARSTGSRRRGSSRACRRSTRPRSRA